MNKLTKSLIIILVATILGSIVFTLKKGTSNHMVFYYSKTCPYCEQVEQYIVNRNFDKKLTITRKLVFETSDKNMDKEEMGRLCGMSMDSVGVPLIYFQRKCYLGAPEIIDLLNKL